MNQAQGINFVRIDADKHLVGIKKDQFIEYLNSVPTDKNGWVNFIQTILQQPVKGFSCKMVHLLPKGVYEEKKKIKENLNNHE